MTSPTNPDIRLFAGSMPPGHHTESVPQPDPQDPAASPEPDAPPPPPSTPEQPHRGGAETPITSLT